MTLTAISPRFAISTLLKPVVVTRRDSVAASLTDWLARVATSAAGLGRVARGVNSSPELTPRNELRSTTHGDGRGSDDVAPVLRLRAVGCANCGVTYKCTVRSAEDDGRYEHLKLTQIAR